MFELIYRTDWKDDYIKLTINNKLLPQKFPLFIEVLTAE